MKTHSIIRNANNGFSIGIKIDTALSKETQEYLKHKSEYNATLIEMVEKVYQVLKKNENDWNKESYYYNFARILEKSLNLTFPSTFNKEWIEKYFVFGSYIRKKVFCLLTSV